MATNYDEAAAEYDGRYARLRYDGIAQTLQQFVGARPCRVLELGSGTGHWLAQLAAQGHRVTGVEPSAAMREKAAAKLGSGTVIAARAEQLPFASESFDRVVAVNALHHFRDRTAALHEARRVLADRGRFLSIGLDPSAAQDAWSLYDYFDGTRARDLDRYVPTAQLRSELSGAGFVACESYVAERIEQDQLAQDALASGSLARHATSQLSELSDAAYAAGIARIEAALREGPLRLRVRLHLFATVATRGP